ncbi:exonuclease domain-containing protein [Gemella sp. Musashino-2025]
MSNLKNNNFCIVDIELTEEKEIIQLAAVKLDSNFFEVDSMNYYIKPETGLSNFVVEFTGITDKQLSNKPKFSDISNKIYNFIKDSILICHGLDSDYGILYKHFIKNGIYYKPPKMFDTVKLSQLFFPMESSYRLSDLANSLNLYNGNNYHNAKTDVIVTSNLLKKITKKISSLEQENYNKILKILTAVKSDIIWFMKFSRTKRKFVKNNIGYIFYAGVKFKKIYYSNKNKNVLGKIFFSAIPEEEYAKMFKIRNYEILKNKSSYVPLNIFSLLPKKKDNNLVNLRIKLIVWILETSTGDFSELNLLNSEKVFLDEIMDYLSNSHKSYYFDIRNKKAQMSKNIITNYSNISNIIKNIYFKNYKLIFENANVLGRELNSKNINFYFYKNVITELNIAISQNPSNKNLKNIRDNLDSLVKFLNEMYISESLFLYNDSIYFIKQDIGILKDEVSNSKLKIPITKSFILNLDKAIINEKNSFKFDNFTQENSLYLKIVNDKNIKYIVNSIHTKKYYYLNVKNRLNISYVSDKNEILFNKIQGRILYIFESNKYRDLYFSERDKKSYIKYINFSSTDNFRDLYIDLNKNNRLMYVCYATKDILEYNCYLKNIFDSIVVLKNLEY